MSLGSGWHRAVPSTNPQGLGTSLDPHTQIKGEKFESQVSPCHSRASRCCGQDHRVLPG